MLSGDIPPAGRTRRLSISEMIFGSPGKGGFSWGQGNLPTSTSGGAEKKDSVTNVRILIYY